MHVADVISEAFIMYSTQVQVETVKSLRLCSVFTNFPAAELYTHRFPSVD